MGMGVAGSGAGDPSLNGKEKRGSKEGGADTYRRRIYMKRGWIPCRAFFRGVGGAALFARTGVKHED